MLWQGKCCKNIAVSINHILWNVPKVDLIAFSHTSNLKKELIDFISLFILLMIITNIISLANNDILPFQNLANYPYRVPIPDNIKTRH